MVAQVEKMSEAGFPNVSALTQYGPPHDVDTNNDGSADLTRLSNWRLQIREDVSNGNWDTVLAHEIGHLMGLSNSPDSNTGTSIMDTNSGSSLDYTLEGPTSCDSQPNRNVSVNRIVPHKTVAG